MKHPLTSVLLIAFFFALGWIVKLQLEQVNAEKLARINSNMVKVAEKKATKARADTELQIEANTKATATFKIENDQLKLDLADCEDEGIDMKSLEKYIKPVRN